MKAEFTLKQGDTLLARCIHRDALGNPVNLTLAGISIASSVRSENGFHVYPLTVTLDPNQVANPGVYHVQGNTASWQLGISLAWDIRYSQAGNSFSTRTIYFELSKAIS